MTSASLSQSELEAELSRERRARELLQAISATTAAAPSVEAVLQAGLDAVCASTGWPVGHVYRLGDDGRLNDTGIWHLPDTDAERFRALQEASAGYRFGPGQGLPGRVLESGRPLWIIDVRTDDNFLRARVVDDLGVRAAFAFPVVSGERVYAVIEFFAETTLDPDRPLLDVMATVGVQLGGVIARGEAEAAVRVATARLRESERLAVAASRAKSAFLASMSHELRTPLNAILGFVELLERDASLGTLQREYLGTISRAGEHLLGLINDALSIARIEAGETRLHVKPFAPARMLRGVRELFRLRAGSRGLGLAFEGASELPPCLEGDEGKLRQVLINLLGNAVKFTVAGGVAVRARYEDGRAYFEVEDSGPGIAPDELPRLFEPFVQTETGLALQQGAGLGLAISRDLVRLLGGEIRVSSTLGVGTRFAFDVPLAVGDPAAAEAEDGEAGERQRVVGLAPGQGEIRVLVADDAPDNRRLLTQLFGAVGLSVREACDGAEALEAWEAFQPHLVCMDMRMPVLDGYAATAALRQREKERAAAGREAGRTVVLALTASAFEQDRPRILEAGCDAIVAKPFREAILFDALEDKLGVRFVREHLGPRGGRETADEAAGASGGAAARKDGGRQAPVLSAARLANLPAVLLEALRAALTDGDDLAARGVADQVAERDPALGAALGARVRRFEFDEILHLLPERAP